jgi:transposase-like protein
VLPVLYLRGLSTGDFAPALSEFFGSDAGLSATTITRLLEAWTDEYQAFETRDLSGDDFVYVWADGVHFRIRLEEDRLCCPVVIGVKADGTKELLACSDGYLGINRVMGWGAPRPAGSGHASPNSRGW